MDAQTLERLLTDQALGELPADTQELLAAYLAEHPAHRQAGEHITRAVRSARDVLNDRVPAPSSTLPHPAEGTGRLRPFPAQAIEQRARVLKRWALAGRITGLAACVLAGIGIHMAWTDRPGPARGGDAVALNVPVHTSVAPADQAPPAPNGGFWSWKEIPRRAVGRRPDPAPRVIWDSPWSTPRLGGST